jgi:hypothetical protein
MKTFAALKMSVCHEIWSQLKKHGLHRLSLLIILVDAKTGSQNGKRTYFSWTCVVLILKLHVLPSSMEVFFTPFKLHQHYPVIYPGSDQIMQTLLPQSQHVRSPISMTDHTLFHDP